MNALHLRRLVGLRPFRSKMLLLTQPMQSGLPWPSWQSMNYTPRYRVARRATRDSSDDTRSEETSLGEATLFRVYAICRVCVCAESGQHATIARWQAACQYCLEVGSAGGNHVGVARCRTTPTFAIMRRLSELYEQRPVADAEGASQTNKSHRASVPFVI